MASSLNNYQTWQATDELYFSHMEAKLVGFSGTKAIQRRKQIEPSNGFMRFRFCFWTEHLLSLVNLLTTWLEFILGFKEEAIIAK